MACYNHRDHSDLETLRADLAALTPAQKALLWLGVVRIGLYKPLWPIRLSIWFVCGMVGGTQGLARLSGTLARLPSRMLDAEWELFLEFLVHGRNIDDPTSAGGFNRRDLQEFLHLARLTGWQVQGKDVLS